MRYLLSIIISFLTLGHVLCQDISVVSFKYVETDLTANTAGTIVLDQNGEKCALIKVETKEDGFTFDVGQLGVVKNERKTGEYWLYVPAGVKRISIFHDRLGIIRDYDLGCTLQSARTYILSLKSASVVVTVKERKIQQWLVFQMEPKNAMVLLEGPDMDLVALENEDGASSKYLKFGTYKYTVQAVGYHTQTGTIKVNDPDNKHFVSIQLSPSFGFLDVPLSGPMSDAVVTVDNNVFGTTPIISKQIPSGIHTVVISKPKYKTFKREITIEDGKTFVLDIPLLTNFSKFAISAVEGSEIWINGVLAGESPWDGELEYGTYLFECRKYNHKTSSKSFDFSADSPTAITLPDPLPICGSLNINSSPTIADIYIDGAHAGQTPLDINELLIGPHEIRISKSGYADFFKTVTIAEEETETLSAKLLPAVSVSISTTALNPVVTLDDHVVSSVDSITALSVGQHTISISDPDCNPFLENFTVTQEGPNKFIFSPERSSSDCVITVNGVSFKMIPVQGGTFQMGATPEQRKYSEKDEKPVHTVTVESFLIGETEVTQELWETIMHTNPSYFYGIQNPVEYVSWNDCQEFISRLNSITGKNFRLPTESEWEFAARGGVLSKGYRFSGGNNIDLVAWYDGNSRNMTHPVRTKSPNELGIYDMSGNVSEWCSDWYDTYPSGLVSNPQGPSSTDSSLRVRRGGCFYFDAISCRVAIRRWRSPTDKLRFLGLRLVM